MEFFIIAMILVILIIGIKKVGNISLKEIKKIGENEELDKVVSKFPENKEICEAILKIVKNEKVKIKESEDNEASLYLAMTDTIFIANIKKSYTRVQTIAHECLHSVQKRSVLLFHFILSNCYLLYYAVLMITTVLSWIFKWQIPFFQNYYLQIVIVTLMSFTLYMVKSYLETDAMIKAKFLAGKYMEENKIGTKEEQIQLIEEYEKLNEKAIPATLFVIFSNMIIKLVIYCILVGVILL